MESSVRRRASAFAWAGILAAIAAFGRDVPFATDELLLATTAPEDARAVDVDGDGDLDIVSYSNGALVWLEQTAGGSPPVFVERSLIDQNSWTYFDPVDIDRDGDLDVALAYSNGDDALVLAWAENDGTPGNGAWARRVVEIWDPPLFGWAHTRAVVAADFDGDGDPDLALSHDEHDLLNADSDGCLRWMRSDGTPGNGGWSEEPLYDWVSDRTFDDLRAVDLDGDGDVDLLGQSWDEDSGIANSVSWWENDGSPGVGHWTRRVIESTASSTYGDGQVAAGDLDGDGDLDVALAVPPDPPRWFASDGTPANGGWVEREITGEELGVVAVIDVDGDGDLDLSGGNRWLENDGTPGSGGWTERPDAGRSAMSDLDQDGDRDFLYSSMLGGPPGAWWEENLSIHRSALLRAERVASSFVDGAFDVAAGDLDRDGDLDLVSVAEANDHVYWHRNSGSPGDDVSWNLSTLTDDLDGPRALALGDMDGDGDLDVVVASFDDDSVSWLENDGSLANWTVRGISAGAGGANDVALGDFDRDGDLDVACAQYLDDEVSWYRNDGASPPAFGAFFVDSLPYDGPRALAAGDLDADGDLDLAVVSEDADRVVWYSNDGTPADAEWWRHRTDSGESDGPKEIALADLDRDGDLDTLVANYVGDDVLWYENDGTLVGWTARTITTCNGPRGVATGDFDRDGDLDALVSCFDEDRVKLQRSNGSSIPDLTTTASSLLGADGARTVLAADLDRDGNLDAALAQGNDGEIAWYENGGGQFRVVGTTIALGPLTNAAVRGIFRAEVTHRGRSSDGWIELAAIAVRLEEAEGDPLDPFQAVSSIDEVRIYGDDGDGSFDPAGDPLLAADDVAGIDADGVVWVSLPDYLLAAAIPALAERTFFVALELADPFLAFAPATLRVTLLTGSDEVCEGDDREHQIPLDLEWRADLSTATLQIFDVLFRDDFETGDTSAWSSVSP